VYRASARGQGALVSGNLNLFWVEAARAKGYEGEGRSRHEWAGGLVSGEDEGGGKLCLREEASREIEDEGGEES
jgi:hypothetical protein